MDTVAIITKGTTNADLPYIDEQFFYLRRRGKDAIMILTFGVSPAIGTDTVTFIIEGGEFFSDITGNTSIGTSISTSTGSKTMYAKIYQDKAKIRFRKSETVSAMGVMSGGGSLWAVCEDKTADGFQSSYMEIYLNDLPYTTSTLATYSPSGNTSTRAACVHIGDINYLAEYPLVYCSLDSRSDNGMYTLNQLSGTLNKKLSNKLYYFALFPTFQAKGFLNDQCSIDLSVLANSTVLTVCNICTVNITGDLSNLANKPNLSELVLDRINSVTGNLSALAGKPLKTIRISSNQLTGSLNSIPATVEILHLMYVANLSGYTSRSWGTVMQSVQLNNQVIPTAELDQLLIDLSKITDWRGWRNVILKGTPSATGLAAISVLQAIGVTVTINNP